MLNSTQKGTLDDLVSEKGIYFEEIRDNPNYSYGLKALYLERAITEECHFFLQTLDKLFDPSLQDDAHTLHIEFIRALKMINDLCFNNPVRFGDFGTRAALDHFFHGLGVINPSEFKVAIQSMIVEQLQQLKETHPEIQEQKNLWLELEPGFTLETQWRVILDLPTEQRIEAYESDEGSDIFEELPYFNPALVRTEFRALTSAQSQLAARNIDAIFELIEHYCALNGLSVEEYNRIYNQLYDINRIVHDALIPFEELFAIERIRRNYIINYSLAVVHLINNSRATLEQLVSLSQEQMLIVLRNPNSNEAFNILREEDIGSRPGMF